ncbi:putative metal-binding motif-containing protein [Flagellimonas sp. 2504JD1-5]
MKKTKLLFNLVFLTVTVTFVSCNEDESPPCASTLYYYDGDGDGYGDRNISAKECIQPAKYVVDSSDPDDTQAAVTPICEKKIYFEDSDGDGYGNQGEARVICNGAKIPEGFILQNADCDDNNPEINPETQNTFYEDLDGDGFGNPNVSMVGTACPVPEGYASNALDCDDTDRKIHPGIIVFQDSDGDGYGNPEVPMELANCSDLGNGYVIDSTDCNDTNANMNPGNEEEIPGDGIDNNCDGISGIIWNGEPIEFSKDALANWTLAQNQDQITKSVTFTRQDSGPLYNYAWWQNTFASDAEHIDGQNSDLVADFFNNDQAAKKDFNVINPSGGTKGVRWAIIKDSIAPLRNPTWAEFQFYGTPGNPEHFYSFNNIVNMVTNLDNRIKTHIIVDEFSTIAGNGTVKYDKSINMGALIGKQLMAWSQEDDIYFYLMITEWEDGKDGLGGAFSYVRSTESIEE